MLPLIAPSPLSVLPLLFKPETPPGRRNRSPEQELAATVFLRFRQGSVAPEPEVLSPELPVLLRISPHLSLTPLRSDSSTRHSPEARRRSELLRSSPTAVPGSKARCGRRHSPPHEVLRPVLTSTDSGDLSFPFCTVDQAPATVSSSTPVSPPLTPSQ